ncbi:MAG: YceI family protein [bacterium]|nr:YceI family protein [bacterium]
MSEAALPEPGTWQLDASHSSIEFVARHLVVTKVRGGFGTFSGTIDIAENPVDTRIAIEVELGSVTTGSADRDGHLTSPDFFDVENHPKMTFVSTSIVAKDDGYELVGDLTVKGVTKRLALNVDYLGVMNDPWGNAKAAFSASGEVNREDWGLSWNAPLEAGGVLVSKTAKIEIEAQATKAE